MVKRFLQIQMEIPLGDISVEEWQKLQTYFQREVFPKLPVASKLVSITVRTEQ